jgi:hypothetical protein
VKSIVQHSLFSAGQQLFAILAGELKPLGNLGFGKRNRSFALGGKFKDWKHEGLIVRDWHCSPLPFCACASFPGGAQASIRNEFETAL